MRSAILFAIAFLTDEYVKGGGARRQPEDGKIVGGSEVKDIREMPYIVAISQVVRNCTVGANGKKKCEDKWQFTCGGSLLNSHYVISACHCMADFENTNKARAAAVPIHRPDGHPVRTGDWRYVAGSRSIQPLERTAQVRVPSMLRWHPLCAQEDASAISDVGIAKMQKPFDINSFVHPVKLFSSERTTFHADFNSMLQRNPYCQVSGWGSTGEEKLNLQTNLSEPSGENSAFGITLKTTKMDVLTQDVCLKKFASWAREDPDQIPYDFKKLEQICIWSPTGTEGFCSGDSGGPFVCNGYYIALVSNSLECGTSLPQVCQMVTSLFDWIRRDVCNKSDCSDVIYKVEPLHQDLQPTSVSVKMQHSTATGIYGIELGHIFTVIVLNYLSGQLLD